MDIYPLQPATYNLVMFVRYGSCEPQVPLFVELILFGMLIFWSFAFYSLIVFAWRQFKPAAYEKYWWPIYIVNLLISIIASLITTPWSFMLYYHSAQVSYWLFGFSLQALYKWELYREERYTFNYDVMFLEYLTYKEWKTSICADMLKKIYYFRLNPTIRIRLFADSYLHYTFNQYSKYKTGSQYVQHHYKRYTGSKLRYLAFDTRETRNVRTAQTPAFWFYNFSSFIPVSGDWKVQYGLFKVFNIVDRNCYDSMVRRHIYEDYYPPDGIAANYYNIWIPKKTPHTDERFKKMIELAFMWQYDHSLGSLIYVDRYNWRNNQVWGDISWKWIYWHVPRDRLEQWWHTWGQYPFTIKRTDIKIQHRLYLFQRRSRFSYIPRMVNSQNGVKFI